MLCEFSKDLSQGLEVKLLCIIQNDICGYFRFCVTEQKIKMLDSYKNCLLRGENMLKGNETMEEVKPEPIKKEIKKRTNRLICKVIRSTPNKIYIDFNGLGIQIQDLSPIKKDKVEVIYEGEIGESTFKIISHKFI
jgi:hypothetical protein